jgi:hypothetical protein
MWCVCVCVFVLVSVRTVRGKCSPHAASAACQCVRGPACVTHGYFIMGGGRSVRAAVLTRRRVPHDMEGVYERH